MYKDENDSEEDFNNPLLNKPGFPQRPSDRDRDVSMLFKDHFNWHGRLTVLDLKEND